MIECSAWNERNRSIRFLFEHGSCVSVSASGSRCAFHPVRGYISSKPGKNGPFVLENHDVRYFHEGNRLSYWPAECPPRVLHNCISSGFCSPRFIIHFARRAYQKPFLFPPIHTFIFVTAYRSLFSPLTSLSLRLESYTIYSRVKYLVRLRIRTLCGTTLPESEDERPV